MILLEGVMPSIALLNGYWIADRWMVILRTVVLDQLFDFSDWKVNVVLEFLDVIRVLDGCITQVNGCAIELFLEERDLVSVDVVIAASDHQGNSLMVSDFGDQMSER